MVGPHSSLSRKTLAVWTAASVWTVSAIAVAQDTVINSAADNYVFEDAFRTLKRNDSLQFELPDAPVVKPPPEWLRGVGDFFTFIFKILGPIFYGLFWIGIGLLIAGALYLLAQTIYSASKASRGRTKKAEPAAPPPLYQPETKRARILLEEIDALAAQGRYDEAVHTLLFRSIQDIDANRPNVIRRSLTSREIGELSILTPAAQTAFASIAQIVERSYFGGRKIGQAEFTSARAAYASLALGDAADQLLSHAA
ncbi:hypothetical protein ACJ3XI_01840 [Litorimonas sp. RW-G-Af-16]|uniref:hypothetical protein n=1 Tax=Litorimonas sp. RW-G-Af-16 TaxID=3241168 RepID=UPI00390CCC92